LRRNYIRVAQSGEEPKLCRCGDSLWSETANGPTNLLIRSVLMKISAYGFQLSKQGGVVYQPARDQVDHISFLFQGAMNG